MKEGIKLNTTEPASDGAEIKSPTTYEHVLELLLKHRGDPLMEIERVLANDRQSILGHCLRAALIVRTDAVAGLFQDHPHITVFPGDGIDVMPIVAGPPED